MNEVHPPCAQVFTDPQSLCHLFLGWFAGQAGALPAIAILTAFAGYQISQAGSGESFARIGGEFLEFAVGLAIALTVPQPYVF